LVYSLIWQIPIIRYNLLKLPREIVSFSGSRVVSYTYTATGQKLRMQEGPAPGVSGTTSVRDYVGPFQYVNGVLTEISTDEGRWTPGGGYEYFIKDHLGNVRVAFGSSGITQYSDYDPWGLALPALSGGASTNRLKYNGKEAITEVGASVYDYGARLYDAQIGRWGVPDPLAELSRRFSPFVYGNNNPVRFIDPDGMATWEYYQGQAAQDKFAEFLASHTLGEPQNSDDPPKKGPPAQATVQTYKPDFFDRWKETSNILGQISYGIADGLYAVGQILSLQGVQNHLGGQGFDSADDAMLTTVGGLATVAGPFLEAPAEVAKAIQVVAKTGSSEIKLFGSLTEKFGEGYKSVSVARGTYVDMKYGQNLNAASKGIWQKVFEAGYLNESKVEVHYFYNSITGQYANPFIKMGEWGSKAFKGLK
jgi:RHS repeat-associated protein